MNMEHIAIIAIFWSALILDALRDSSLDAQGGGGRPEWMWSVWWWHIGIKPVGAALWIALGVMVIRQDILWFAYPGAILVGFASWNLFYAKNRYGDWMRESALFLPWIEGDYRIELTEEGYSALIYSTLLGGVVLLAAEVVF